MSENNVTNNVYVSGQHNQVSFSQHNEFGSDNNEALGLVLKFIASIIMLPVMLYLNYMQGNLIERRDDGHYDS